jgi:hypothetical protein
VNPLLHVRVEGPYIKEENTTSDAFAHLMVLYRESFAEIRRKAKLLHEIQ